MLCQSLVHQPDHLEQPHRVGIEHGRRLTAKALRRIVAAQGQHIRQPGAAQRPQSAFQAVAVVVLARDVDYHFHTLTKQVLSEYFRPKVWISTGVVGYEGNIGVAALGEAVGHVLNAAGILLHGQPARSFEFHRDEEPVRLLEKVA